MKLLIITQVIDTEHPILGFFHRWVIEFASQCDHVHIICLQEGQHHLPANVTVYSLGKESGAGRLTYLWRFYKLIWQLRHEYDDVFVHMNQIYVLLGAPFWRVWSKQIGLWYAHGAVSTSLRLAVPLTHHVFTSTPEGLQIDTPKKRIVGQGIDTDLFTAPTNPKAQTETLKLVTVGRIASSKNIDTLLRACAKLVQNQINFHFTIIGVATNDSEREYEQAMKSLVTDLSLQAHVTWVGAVTQLQLPAYLQQSDIFIHDGATNSLDKTLLEAVLCGCVVLSSNPAYKKLTESIAPGLLFDQGDYGELVRRLIKSIDDRSAGPDIRSMVLQNFTVANLVTQIQDTYKN